MSDVGAIMVFSDIQSNNFVGLLKKRKDYSYPENEARLTAQEAISALDEGNITATIAYLWSLHHYEKQLFLEQHADKNPFLLYELGICRLHQTKDYKEPQLTERVTQHCLPLFDVAKSMMHLDAQLIQDPEDVLDYLNVPLIHTLYQQIVAKEQPIPNKSMSSILDKKNNIEQIEQHANQILLTTLKEKKSWPHPHYLLNTKHKEKTHEFLPPKKKIIQKKTSLSLSSELVRERENSVKHLIKILEEKTKK